MVISGQYSSLVVYNLDSVVDFDHQFQIQKIRIFFTKNRLQRRGKLWLHGDKLLFTLSLFVIGIVLTTRSVFFNPFQNITDLF